VLAQDDALARKVGGVTLGLLAAAIGFFVFAYGRLDWGAHVRLRVRFHDTTGLAEGAPFMVAGRAAGRVESIAFGDGGLVVVVSLPARAAELVDAAGDVFVASNGVVSPRYLELAPPREPTRPVKDGDTLVGKDAPSLDRVVQHTWDNMNAFASFREDIRPQLDALTARLAELRALAAELPGSDRFDQLVADASDGWHEYTALRERGLGGDAGTAHLGAVIDHARTMIAQGRAALDKLAPAAQALRTNTSAVSARFAARGDVVDKLSIAIDRAREDIDKADKLLAAAQALLAIMPDGTMAKLSADPEFPEDTKELGKYLKRHPWKIIAKPRN
jgi:ABC-type transporter Mla subunit MlaD